MSVVAMRAVQRRAGPSRTEPLDGELFPGRSAPSYLMVKDGGPYVRLDYLRYRRPYLPNERNSDKYLR